MVAGTRGAFAIGDAAWASAWVERARDVLPTLARQPAMLELEARLAIAEGKLGRASAALQEAQDRAQHFGDLGGVVRALVGLAEVASLRGQDVDALNLVQQALAQPHQVDPVDQALASRTHGMLLRRLEAPERAAAVLQHALRKMINRDVPDLWIGALAELAWALGETGQPEAARRQARAARFFAERLGHPALRLEAALTEASLEVLVGGEADLETPAQLLERMGDAAQTRLVRARGELQLGRMLEAVGQGQEGRVRVERALEAARGMGALGLV